MMLLAKLQEIQVKHVVQIVVCMMIIYLLRTRQSYQFSPAWRKDLDLSLYRNNWFPAYDEILPAPLVEDLEGDGLTEIVLITNDMKLQTCKFRSKDSAGRMLPHLDVLYSEDLPIRSDTGRVRDRPVVMETGYLDQYNENQTDTRTQVIVVLYSSWRVVCYDHKLRLLWQQSVSDIIDSLAKETQDLIEYDVRAMGIMIIPHRLNDTDRGLVIIGGSMINQKQLREKSRNQQTYGDQSASPLTRFATFALEGSNGSLKWYHHPSVVKEGPIDDPDKAWKPSMRRGHWAQSNVDWSKYGAYLMKHTPHHWHSLRDTTFDLANIQRTEPKEAKKQSTVEHSPLADLGTDHLIGHLFGGMRPHSRHEHIVDPNAVLVHNDVGMEVLNLYTGEHISTMALKHNKAVYADVNEDGKLDQVLADFDGVCNGDISIVQPRPKDMYTRDICSSVGWWTGKDTDTATENTHLSVPPIVVKSVSRPKGFLNHLLGKALPTERRGYDSIFLTSVGGLTSLNSYGHKNWQVQTTVEWSEKTQIANDHSNYRHSPEGTIYYESFRPSMLPYSLQVYGAQTYAVITGWKNIALVQLEDGYNVGEHSLPCQPIEPPVLADFNTDGWTDIIITCPTGYVGMSVHSDPQYLYMTILSITIILAIILLSWCCQIEQSDTDT